jgi:imidazolonepropionase-like amidohydrolase
MLSCCLWVLSLAVPTAGAGDSKPTQDSDVVALVGGRVMTMDSQGTLEQATVLIRDGKIEAIGGEIEVPADATRLDVTGLTVIPGLIDSRSTLWLSTDSIGASASDGSLNPLDAINLHSDSWKEVARGGVTAVAIQPVGSLGGRSVVLQVLPADTVGDLVIDSDSSVQASLGVTGNTNSSRDRYNQFLALKKTFDAAKKYQEEWKKYQDALKAKDKKAAQQDSDKKDAAKGPAKTDSEAPQRPQRRGSSGQRGTGRPQPVDDSADEKEGDEKPTTESKASKDSKSSEEPKEPEKDPAKELLVQVLEKKLPLRIEAHRADDVANALKLADEFELDVILEGVSQAGRSWEPLKTRRVPLVAGPFAEFESAQSWFSDDDEPYREMSDSDNLLAIATYSRNSRGSRLLRFHAASAVSQGIDPDRALRAITIDAARMLGVDSLTGSLTAGKRGDVAVVAGDPLNPAATVVLTLSNGTIAYQKQGELPTAVTAASSADSATIAHNLPETMPARYALVSERVLRPDGFVAPAAVIVRDGTVTAVNKRKKAGNLPVFDLGNAFITPGLVATHVVNEETTSQEALRGYIRAIDAVDPQDTSLLQLARDGFTTVAFAPDAGSVVAGQVGALKTGSSVAPIGDDTLAVKFVLAADARSSERYPASLAGQLELTQQYLDGQDTTTPLYLPASIRERMADRQGALVDGLKSGATRAVFQARTVTEINAALRLIEEYKLNATLLRPSDLREHLDRIVKLKVDLIVEPARSTDYDWRFDEISSAAEAGVRVGVAGSDADAIRNTVALLVSRGMSPAAGYRALTSDAAAIAGISASGRIQPEATADLIVWDDSPLNPAARPLHIFVDGQFLKEQR